MKSGADRSDKYAAKFDAEVVRSRFAATATIAKTAQVTRQQELAAIGLGVRQILDEAGIMPILTVGYLSFGNKLYGISKKFTGLTLANSAQLEYQKWVGMLGSAASPVLEDIWALIPELYGYAPSPI